MSKTNDGYFGTQTAATRSGEYNAMTFVIRSLLAERSHVMLVKVIAVGDDGLLGVQPMVNQVDADGNAIEHGVISGIPVFRLQAGTSAVILDPLVDDIGLCVFADRDISSVIANRDVSNPGSMRQSNMTDGLYLGGYLNVEPEQYVKMDANGIVIHSPTLIKLEAPEIRLEAEDLIALSAPAVTIDSDTVDIDASSSTTVTTPTFTVNGNSQFNGTAAVSGLASLNGGFAALPKAGGGASTINSDVSITGATDTTGTLTNNGKNVGAAHTHSGVQPGGGNTGGVN